MIGVLTLGLIERIVNSALNTDPVTISHLNALSGKTFRVIVANPSISIDVLFCDHHLRFEPVSQSLFEPQGGISTTPDCTLSVANPRELLTLIQNPSGNLPIQGDHEVLMQIKAISENFSPDVFAQLENLVGKNGVSYAHMLTQEAPPIVSPILNSLKSMLTGMITPSHDSTLDNAISQKKQELLRLQSDIEREQTRLNILKNQQ